MQPHDPYNQPEHGGQYPSGPYPPQGGAHPSGGYPQPQGYGQSGGYPPPHGQPGMPPGPPPMGPGAKMPGTLTTARVFKFIGGVTGLIFGIICLAVAAYIAGDDQAVQEMNEVLAQDAAVPGGVSSGEVIGGFVAFGAVPFVYGLISTLLASFMGKRSAVVLWGTVVFQTLAALLLALFLVTGGLLGFMFFSVPLLFTIGIIVLMVVPASREYFSPPPQAYAPGPQY